MDVSLVGGSEEVGCFGHAAACPFVFLEVFHDLKVFVMIGINHW